MTSKALSEAINIVNAVLEEGGVDVATRQRINDDCDRFVVGFIERAEQRGRDAERERCVRLVRVFADAVEGLADLTHHAFVRAFASDARRLVEKMKGGNE